MSMVLETISNNLSYLFEIVCSIGRARDDSALQALLGHVGRIEGDASHFGS